MRVLHRLLARFRAWKANRGTPRLAIAMMFQNAPPGPANLIRREVTRNGVRVLSLCGCCGARLQTSATLCEECAQRRSNPARPL